MRILLISAALLVFFASNTSQAAPVVWLDAGAAFGVSADGRVVVGAGMSNPSGPHVFMWTAAGGITPLTATGDARAYDVSADGSVIAGDEAIGSNLWGRYWVNGIGRNIGPVPGAPIGLVQPRAVSQDGTIIVGRSYGPPGVGRVAFRWTSATGPVALPRLSLAGVDSGASDISGDGSTIVGSSEDPSRNGVAVRWTDAGITPLGDLPGGSFRGGASAVSYDGSVIVGASSSAASGLAWYEPFRWTPTTGMVGLGLVGEQPSAGATDVSADGSIVIGYTSNTGVGDNHAFIWTEAGGTRLLSDFLAEMGVNLGTSELLRAEAISADGTVIVGTGRVNGNERAFVVTVPEPSAGLAAGLAMLALSPRRRAPSRPKQAVNP